MLTRNRLLALKKWAYQNLCKGRQMKSPGDTPDICQIMQKEPQVYLGWWPTRADKSGFVADEIINIPGILICPNVGNAKYVEDKRFDTYKNIVRPQEMGQWLNVSFLFAIYEPGIRLPGFTVSAKSGDGMDMGLIAEGSEAGLFTLFDWLDEAKSTLLAAKSIPDSDLFLDEASLEYGPYLSGGYIADKRPLFYGFLNARFQCHADEKRNGTLEKFLK